jgi:hypothetical protein
MSRPRRPPSPEVVELSGVYERPITPPPPRPPFEGDIPLSSVFQRDDSKVFNTVDNLMFTAVLQSFGRVLRIDIRRLFRPPPTTSTCDFMYNRQRPPINYGGQKQNYYLTPLYRSSPFIGEQRWQPIQLGHSLHIRGCGGGVLDTILMSLVLRRKNYSTEPRFQDKFGSRFRSGLALDRGSL